MAEDCHCEISERTEDVGRKPSKIVTYEDEYTRIEINETWCKGCVQCVYFCPTDTLEMKGVKASVADMEKCIQCNACEMRCPDFAITMEPKKKRPKKKGKSKNDEDEE